MCGILGIFSSDPQMEMSPEQFLAMRDEMKHRGPDDAGVFFHREPGLMVGLAHRRLSIIDLSPLGRQPMSTADGSLWVVFNGEIFNYRELRDELLKTGKYAFKSKSDTEVLLYAVREWGLNGCLERVRGMYAFALFDQSDHSLTLVRDPLGVKPLYYRMGRGEVIFASEIKAILKAPQVSREIDPQALSHYLTFANAPSPATLFRGIRKLEAGTYLRVLKNGRTETIRYWSGEKFPPQEALNDENYCVLEIRRLFRQAVQRRMVSDVPFGVFLSGGVDSSLNVALMAEMMDRPVETYSIGIKGDPSNELEHAGHTARVFNTRHHEILIEDKDILSFLDRMAYYQDEPLADPVCVPLYYVSKLARDTGTLVIQVGEGSDEIFAGYEVYRQFQSWEDGGYRYYGLLPGIVKWLMYRGASSIFSDPILLDALRRASRVEPLFLGNAVAFWDWEKQRLLQDGASPQSSSSFVKALRNGFRSDHALPGMILLELRNRLPELLLMRVDKMSMAASIETRVPFLDEDLVQFALQIPPGLKQKNGLNKYILKKAAEGILSKEIIYRKKWGFCGSATNILTDPIRQYARQRILGSSIIRDLFNQEYIHRIFNNHQSQRRFNSFKIWNLLNLVLWHDRWFEKRETTGNTSCSN
ncbi:MAG: asparagine synthase (glutamine-hydrolyzing) [Syntrophaceae bacterium]|nr:asparagine synthase (glutamine-hydrolyzing) [Syntrophaceae bacterium]